MTMLVLSLKYALATATAISLLTSCAGGSSTPATPNAFQQNHSHANEHATACPCLYVTNVMAGPGTGSITVYASSASGNATPIQNISGSNTGLSTPHDIAVDGSGNMYVANSSGGPSVNGSITVYAAGATGNASPIETITGNDTGLDDPEGIALDPVNGDIYVANQNSVMIYPQSATGNVTPIGTIQGAKTKLDIATGLALDVSGNIYVPNYYGDDVTIYAAGQTGNIAPTRIIKNRLGAVIDFPEQLALDASTNTYVANRISSTYGSAVIYKAGVKGKAKPRRVIEGVKTRMEYPAGIALDGSNNIYVANYGSSAITVYAPAKTKNAKPIKTISGANTGLNGPEAITIR